jgi:hypothetical protein
MSAYQDAVTAINVIATNPRPTEVRQELVALKTLIDLELDKLAPDQPDYTTEGDENAN